MMRVKQAFLAAVVAASMVLPASAHAADAPAAVSVMSFGVVDTNKVVQSSDAAKGILGEMEGKRKELQAQIAKEEDALRAAGQEFEKQKSTLSKEQLEAKHKEIEQRLYNGQKMVQDSRALLDRTFGESMNKLRGETTKIVADIAKEKGLSAVFTQDAVMLSVPEMDITGEVIQRLNQKVKKIAIDWSAAKKSDKKD